MNIIPGFIIYYDYYGHVHHAYIKWKMREYDQDEMCVFIYEIGEQNTIVVDNFSDLLPINIDDIQQNCSECTIKTRNTHCEIGVVYYGREEIKEHNGTLTSDILEQYLQEMLK